MVKGQDGQLGQSEPARRPGVAGSPNPGTVWGEECGVGHRDDPFPGIPVRRTKGVELLQINALDSRFLLQLPARRRVQGLVDLHKAAGQGPGPPIGILGPLDQ